MLARLTPACVLLTGVLATANVPSVQAQVKWSQLTLDEAIEQANRTGELVLVEIHSDGCGQCSQLEGEIWSTRDGAELVADLIALRFETTSTEASAFKRRYPITGTPTVLFLNGEGREVGRVISYTGRDRFLDDAVLLRHGIDPVPELEAALESDPEDLPVLAELLETYLHRKREEDAERLLSRILELDPHNDEERAGRALAVMARHYSGFRGEHARSDSYWRTLVTRFPDAATVGSAVQGTLERARSTGSMEAWIEWSCALASKHPDAGPFQYSLALAASRAGLTHSCLAAAARRAYEQAVGPARMDSLATVLEGTGR